MGMQQRTDRRPTRLLSLQRWWRAIKQRFDFYFMFCFVALLKIWVRCVVLNTSLWLLFLPCLLGVAGLRAGYTYI
ncbi:uncharacterized protein K452DRAFT_136678 [Aplosporella prunicola CBS 121167]|uniref:Uncharacterized protein n=1 Tax=Aplosporella prunicola CBS 121167 TaxID=1176127 RepID=A0A6A6BM87_9PEZI|nr:uncharacterized protein K452DRAFT_136678 [Aplosporella prunicola CBS 121167]KAF2145239.1 hypothetical protein K452DRAFT_136678 [Aplosporella prunicola CBS 121167]